MCRFEVRFSMDCGNLDLQLWQTVDENDIARGRELLEKGASVNARHEGFWVFVG